MAFLDVVNITKKFGALVANQDVSFSIGEGEIVGLIGPNGAGKTTLFNCVVGYHRADAGKVLFRGKDITGMRPFETNREGIGRTFQVMKVTEGMSVVENVMVGAYCRVANRKVARGEAEEVLAFLGLEKVTDYHMNELPIAMQRKVGLARALATKPQLLMLDEVASGLNHSEMDEMVQLLKRLNAERKVTLFLIEHIMEMVMNVSQRVIVLDGGVKIAEGEPEAIVRNQEVIKAYLGEKYAKGL
jgi:branched-chain amino acid transport system ATP-binding protein